MRNESRNILERFLQVFINKKENGLVDKKLSNLYKRVEEFKKNMK